ncbi:hypothetical protein EYF80_042628 [Liparis tanakae]|uniref:Uncharacterized protein n=1 Tax=Liparis tanakae TaxID=230148 RepID=A0A4Z2G0U5_9TELE|nr:hypothetical protein EYF80_042628 [Liparis tanakae]
MKADSEGRIAPGPETFISSRNTCEGTGSRAGAYWVQLLRTPGGALGSRGEGRLRGDETQSFDERGG